MPEKASNPDSYRAYKVVWSGIPETDTYVAAQNVGCAKAFILCQIELAEFPVQYVELTGVRAREFDRIALTCKKTTGLGWRDNATGEAWGCCENTTPAAAPAHLAPAEAEAGNGGAG